MGNDRDKDRDIEREREKDSHKDVVETEQTFGKRKKVMDVGGKTSQKGDLSEPTCLSRKR